MTELSMVGTRGLEPPRLAAHAPKACVSTNSTMSPELVKQQYTSSGENCTDLTSLKDFEIIKLLCRAKSLSVELQMPGL